MGWQQLKAIYQQQGIALALGAGVSFLSELPDWTGLLRGIARRCPGVSSDRTVTALKKGGFGLAAIASMLRLRCPPDLEFSEVVRDALYEKFEPYKQRHKHNLDLDTVLQRACSKNYTLRAVAALCAKWDDQTRSFVRNDRIHAVVNFNLDALLREYVAVRYKRPLTNKYQTGLKKCMEPVGARCIDVACGVVLLPSSFVEGHRRLFGALG
jgi:hypothetical protein